MAACTSTFFGTALPARRPAAPARAGPVTTSANLGKRAQETVERGYKSQVRKAGKLLPNNQKLMDQRPGVSQKLSNARNVPREGGFGAGGPWQKSGGVQSAALITHACAVMAKMPSNIDPLLFVGALAVAFIALTYTLTTTSTTLQ